LATRFLTLFSSRFFFGSIPNVGSRVKLSFCLILLHHNQVVLETNPLPTPLPNGLPPDHSSPRPPESLLHFTHFNTAAPRPVGLSFILVFSPYSPVSRFFRSCIPPPRLPFQNPPFRMPAWLIFSLIHFVFSSAPTSMANLFFLLDWVFDNVHLVVRCSSSFHERLFSGDFFQL